MTIYQRNNKLYIQYYVGSHRKRKATGLDDTLQNRKLIKKEIFPEIAKMITTGIVPTIEKNFNYYADTYIKEKKHLKEISRYKKLVEYYQELYGQRMMNNITKHDVKQLCNTLLENNSPKTVSFKLSVLRGIFKQAQDDDALKKNPCDNITLPKHEKPDIEPIPLTDIEKLLDVTDGWFHNFIAIAVYTGMRTGELIGLQWKNVSSDYIHVKKSLRLGKLTTPKTKGSIRDIPINESLRYYLDQQKKLTVLNDYVFVNSLGKNLFDASTIRKNYWIPAVKRAEIKYNKPYATRHTFAVEALNSGKMRVTDIAKIMGHVDTTMLLTTYARFIESEKIKAVDIFTFGHNTVTVKNEEVNKAL